MWDRGIPLSAAVCQAKAVIQVHKMFRSAAIYIVGAQEPGIARGMGLKTRAAFEEALADAKRKFVGENPNILALPKTFKVGAVHLCMKDEPYDGTNGCGC